MKTDDHRVQKKKKNKAKKKKGMKDINEEYV